MKKFMAICLIFTLLLGLSACSKKGKDDPIVGDATSYSGYIEVMEDIKGYGDETDALYLPVQTNYYYSYAAASVGSLRYAVEYVLWLKGEGDTLENFTADSAVTGWENLTKLNYASPYPYYFHGLILEFQGKTEEAVKPYAFASILPMFPGEGLDFYYLKDMDVDALYELRNRLHELEDQLYEVYTPKQFGVEADPNFFYSEYIREKIQSALKEEDFTAALSLVEISLTVDPFDVQNWRSALYCTMAAKELEQMGAYLDEGLLIFPEDEVLLEFEKVISNAAEDKQ